ncbi:hypothetical protein [Kutzneria sp. NPDC051319]|uniref:hypothetical protein n=1 Tax=Kutzneria sp. NPDC051319 TaxID=3155047 RepID=UPI0034161143
MRVSSRWETRAADSDAATVAAVWADPEAPPEILAVCPERVVQYLATQPTPLRRAVLANPNVVDAIKAQIAKRARGYVRRSLARDILEHGTLEHWLLLADVFTSASLREAVSALRGDRPWLVDRNAALPSAAAVMRGFSTSHNHRHRALAAEAFDVNTAPEHSWAEGALSAVLLVADPHRAVRKGLARNYEMRNLSTDIAGLTVRKALLADPDPGVRTAALRNGVHITNDHVIAHLGAIEGDLVPLAQLQPLTADPLDDASPRVRATAVRGLCKADILGWTRVAQDTSPIVRAAAATSGWWTPEFVWKQLVRDPDLKVRTAVARSRWTPSTILRQMTGDTDPDVAHLAQQRIVAEPAGD